MVLGRFMVLSRMFRDCLRCNNVTLLWYNIIQRVMVQYNGTLLLYMHCKYVEEKHTLPLHSQ